MRNGGGHSYTALESGKVEFCAIAMAPVIGPYSGNTPVTIHFQGKIPHGQSEVFCFFGSKRVTSDSLYYNADDDSIVRAPICIETLPTLHLIKKDAVRSSYECLNESALRHYEPWDEKTELCALALFNPGIKLMQ